MECFPGYYAPSAELSGPTIVEIANSLEVQRGASAFSDSTLLALIAHDEKYMSLVMEGQERTSKQIEGMVSRMEDFTDQLVRFLASTEFRDEETEEEEV